MAGHRRSFACMLRMWISMAAQQSRHRTLNAARFCCMPSRRPPPQGPQRKTDRLPKFGEWGCLNQLHIEAECINILLSVNITFFSIIVIAFFVF